MADSHALSSVWRVHAASPAFSEGNRWRALDVTTMYHNKYAPPCEPVPEAPGQRLRSMWSVFQSFRPLYLFPSWICLSWLENVLLVTRVYLQVSPYALVVPPSPTKVEITMQMPMIINVAHDNRYDNNDGPNPHHTALHFPGRVRASWHRVGLDSDNEAVLHGNHQISILHTRTVADGPMIVCSEIRNNVDTGPRRHFARRRCLCS